MEEPLDSRKESLCSFYAKHDASKVAEVESLLSKYDHKDLANALLDRYGEVPEGWEDLLQEVAEEGVGWGGWLNKVGGAGVSLANLSGTPQQRGGECMRSIAIPSQFLLLLTATDC
jgi:hypothetical protein